MDEGIDIGIVTVVDQRAVVNGAFLFEPHGHRGQFSQFAPDDRRIRFHQQHEAQAMDGIFKGSGIGERDGQVKGFFPEPCREGCACRFP